MTHENHPLDADLQAMLGDHAGDDATQPPQEATTSSDLDALAPDPDDHDTDTDTDPSVYDLALQRSRLVAGKLQKLSEHVIDFMESGRTVPPEAMLSSIGDMMVAVASDPGTQWQTSLWRFLEHASVFAKAIDARGGLWQQGMWPPGAWQAVAKMEGEVSKLLCPPAPPRPRKVGLETLEELQQQKVGRFQMCKIFGWTSPDGLPDYERLAKAKAGEVKTPAYTVLPPEGEATPSRQPHLGIVDAVAERVLRDEQAAMEPMLPQV